MTFFFLLFWCTLVLYFKISFPILVFSLFSQTFSVFIFSSLLFVIFSLFLSFKFPKCIFLESMCVWCWILDPSLLCLYAHFYLDLDWNALTAKMLFSFCFYVFVDMQWHLGTWPTFIIRNNKRKGCRIRFFLNSDLFSLILLSRSLRLIVSLIARQPKQTFQVRKLSSWAQSFLKLSFLFAFRSKKKLQINLIWNR